MREKKADNKASHNNYLPTNNTTHLDFGEVRQAAYGRWESIHAALGVQLRTTSSRKHTPCPACGGRDRFRVLPDYQQSGRWLCSGGGDKQQGDGFSLLGHVFGWSVSQQFKAVADHLGLSSASPIERQRLRAQSEKQAEAMRQDALKKAEQARRDAMMLDCLIELEDALKQRQNYQRTASGINGRYVVQPTERERKAAYDLNKIVLGMYANG